MPSAKASQQAAEEEAGPGCSVGFVGASLATDFAATCPIQTPESYDQTGSDRRGFSGTIEN